MEYWARAGCGAMVHSRQYDAHESPAADGRVLYGKRGAFHVLCGYMRRLRTRSRRPITRSMLAGPRRLLRFRSGVRGNAFASGCDPCPYRIERIAGVSIPLALLLDPGDRPERIIAGECRSVKTFAVFPNSCFCHGNWRRAAFMPFDIPKLFGCCRNKVHVATSGRVGGKTALTTPVAVASNLLCYSAPRSIRVGLIRWPRWLHA